MELQRVRYDLPTKQQQQPNLFIWEEKLYIIPVDEMKNQSQSSISVYWKFWSYIWGESKKKKLFFSKFHVAHEKYCRVR